MAGPLKPISQYDYSGGANPVVSHALLSPKQSRRIHNFILDEHGMLRTVDGTLITTTAPNAVSGYRILMPLFWQPVSAASQQLVITNPLSGANVLYDRSVNPWSVVGPFVGNTHIPHYSVLNNVLIFTDGYNPPFQWTGAAFNPVSALAAKPCGGQICIEHQGFLYLFNTSDTATATDGPSTLRQSDLNDPLTWNDAQIVFIAKDNGQVGRGAAAFTIAEAGIAPVDTLVLFKDTFTYQMIGNLGTGGGAPSSNFQLQQVKTDMGCYAEKSIQFCAGFGILRLSHRGFALFDGVNDLLVSEEIRPYLFGRDDIVGIDWDNVDYSWASQSPNPPLYICFCPTVASGINMTRAFVYDLIRRAWTVVDIPFGIASIAFVTPPNTLPQVLLGDSPVGAVGNIRRWFSQDETWDGTPIDQILFSRLAMDGSPLQRLYFRRLQVGVIADASPVTVTTVVECNNGITKSSQYTLGSTTTPWDSFPSLLETTIDTTCEAAYFEMAVTGRCRIMGHEFHVRKKPLIGSRTLVRPTS